MKLLKDTIYRAKSYKNVTSAGIVVRNGTINMYGSNADFKPSSLTEMSLDAADTGIRGSISFGSMPKWIAYAENTADGADPIIVEDNEGVIKK